MLKRLKRFLNIFKCCRIKPGLLPNQIEDSEKIARSIYSPINVSKDEKSIKANTFKPPAGSEDLSVNRLDYTTLDFCKKGAKKGENPQSKRNYFGIGLLTAKDIRDSDCYIIYSPILKPKKERNLFHSDIKLGFKTIKGQQLPAEIQYKVDQLVIKTRLYKDHNPYSEKWNGPEI